MSARELGTVRTYDELHRVLRQRVIELNLRMTDIDAAMKTLPEGYASKLLAPVPIRKMGDVSMGPLLAALGLKLLVVEDIETLAKIEAALRARGPKKRIDAHDAMLTVKRQKKRRYRKLGPEWGRLMAARRVLLTRERDRQLIAAKAARARWAKVKATKPYVGLTKGLDP